MKSRDLAVGSLIALSASAAAEAQGDRPEPYSVPAPAQPGEQPMARKESFLKKLLEDSARRVAANRNDEAERRLAAAREHHARALDALRMSDFLAAEQQLNAALGAAGEALRLAPDPARLATELRARYSQLTGGIESLTASYGRHLRRVKALPAGAPLPPDADIARIGDLIQQAKDLAAAERLAEANLALAQAEQTLMFALNRILGGETLEYAQQFETQAEEFAYELERNRSYLDLIPPAIAELRPSAGAAQLVERYVEQSRSLREQAHQSAQAQDYQRALTSLKAGTLHLQRALSAAGLVVPAEPKTE